MEYIYRIETWTLAFKSLLNSVVFELVINLILILVRLFFPHVPFLFFLSFRTGLGSCSWFRGKMNQIFSHKSDKIRCVVLLLWWHKSFQPNRQNVSESQHQSWYIDTFRTVWLGQKNLYFCFSTCESRIPDLSPILSLLEFSLTFSSMSEVFIEEFSECQP